MPGAGFAAGRAQQPVVAEKHRAALIEHAPDADVDNPGEHETAGRERPLQDSPLSPDAGRLTQDPRHGRPGRTAMRWALKGAVRPLVDHSRLPSQKGRFRTGCRSIAT